MIFRTLVHFFSARGAVVTGLGGAGLSVLAPGSVAVPGTRARVAVQVIQARGSQVTRRRTALVHLDRTIGAWGCGVVI